MTMVNAPRVAIALLALTAFSGFGAELALSQGAKPQPQPPKPPTVETWRAPLGRFLHDVGIPNAESLVASTKATILGGSPEVIVFRLEGESTCLNAICLTIVGSIENGVLGSPAMLFAPKTVTQSDASPAFLGSTRTPRITFSESKDPGEGVPAISVLRTPKGWIIVPH
jgi:hypothetical protein